MVMRYYRSLCIILPLLLGLAGTARAEMSKSTISQSTMSRWTMSKDTSWSAGSFFAAAHACERHKFVSDGQVDAILADLDRYLSPPDKRRLKHGFAEGARSGRVFIPQRGWIASAVDEAECARIQAVLDEYKGILDLTLPAAGLSSERTG